MIENIEDKILYKGIFEASVEGILVADSDGVILKVNAATERMFAYDKDELEGQKIEVLIPRDLRKTHVKNRNSYAKKPDVRNMGAGLDLWGLRKDGSKFPLEISLSPSVIDGEKMVIAYIMDITKRRETEVKLQNSLEKNEAILKALPDMIFVVNKDRVYIDAHSSDIATQRDMLLKLVGYSIFNSMPEEIHERIKAAFDKVEREQKNQLVEYVYEIDGESKHFESRVVPFGETDFLVVVRDTSEHKDAQQNLFIKNRALESAANAIVIVDAGVEGLPIVYLNHAFEQMTGYTRDEALGKNCRFLQGEDRKQKQIGQLKNAIKKGAACNVELRNYKKDGTLFWNHVTITPIKDESGNVTHYIGVQNDITERKKEEILKDQLQKALEMIATHEPLQRIASLIVKTVEDQIENSMVSILTVNDSKKTLHKLVAPHVPQSFTEKIEGLKIGLNTGSCGTAAYLKEEVIVADIATNKLWVNYKDLALSNDLRACWSLPILSSDKKVLGTFAVYDSVKRSPTVQEMKVLVDASKLVSIALEQHDTDITLYNNQKELKQYADRLEDKVRSRTNELSESIDQLMEANSRLEAQVEETKIAELKALANQTLYSAIAQHFPNGIIVVIDKAYQLISLHGEDLAKVQLDDESLKGNSIDEIKIFSPNRIELIKKNVDETLNGKHISIEIEIGDQNYKLDTIPLYNGLLKPNQALFVYSNITNQKNIEKEMLNALLKEKELGELKSRFLAMASHEFRTPLSTILSSATLIGKLNDQGNEEKRASYVKRIKANVRDLVSILNDFLSLGKLEDGKIKTSLQDLDIIQFSKNIIEELEHNKKKDQTIRFISDTDTLSSMTDEGHLRHIIQNLLSNAIKYSKEGKEVIYEIKTTKKQFTIAITDQGIGIPEKEQANLFQRFFRAQNVTNIQGTGLGLHIVQKYVELLGGDIKFESALNEGSIFTVSLPINKSK